MITSINYALPKDEMSGAVILGLFLAIIVIIVAVVVLLYSLGTGGNLTSISDQVSRESQRIDQLQARFTDAFSPYANLTKEDAKDFLIQFVQDHCTSALFTCNIQEFPNLYDSSKCIPTCELLNNVRVLCNNDESLSDNAICQLIPDPLSLQELSDLSGLSVDEILEILGGPRDKIPLNLRS